MHHVAGVHTADAVGPVQRGTVPVLTPASRATS
jgi:hypothetical protein